MIIIYTRQNQKGDWWCNTHIENYTEFFVEGKTQSQAKDLMRKELSRRNLDHEDIIWKAPEYYKHESPLPDPPIKSMPSRIDRGMV